ncbi:TonB-dependent receptor [Flavobacterium sp. ZT3R18]|uniref:TonB-dependent receptor domain-containing protein n=1 Tax=Flavobacterium sp. ZT3R18 TaxID=2594429 RepID=UPI00117AEFE1|nr:TonB-dependent receptor [Flavobacterium sp. ZT3R18]TRX37409.1 TonB-dependent receptor [Flavobacterium sp. ZT3R18]
MKKTIVKQRLLLRIMKITLFQFVLALVFSSVATANDMRGQKKLDTKISVSLNDLSLDLALNKLEKLANVKFSYNSRMTQLNQKVSINANNETLSSVLTRILKPLKINYTEVSNQIVLQKETNQKVGINGVVLSMIDENPVKGKVVNEKGEPLSGVTVLVKGTQTGTSTDVDGSYTISAKTGDVLQFSYIGLETKSVTVTGDTVNVTLIASGEVLHDVVIVGSRNPARTVTESAVPIDVINMKDIASQGPQVNLNQIMNMVAPSFTSNTQTVADGTDHIDPAQLRGLGPDQVLVLVNGKRRHTSSLVNINGTPGRGSVGTDLNALPAFAIEKIEVLRDGASAQYGSDAIAGVININAKKNTNKFDIALFAGSNFSKNANDHTGGNDGNNYQLDMNYGTGLGKEKSFINLTGSFQLRDATSRAGEETNTIFNAYNAVEQRAAGAGVNINSLFGNITNTPNTTEILSAIKTYAPQVSYFTAAQQTAISNANTVGAMQTALNFDATAGELAYRNLVRKDFNMNVGQSSLQSAQFFLNAAYPITDKLEVYTFGGTSYRTGESAGFYRKPNQARSYTGLYPNGFLPEIHSTINDLSVAAGLRGKLFGNWDFDLSNTFGKNTFDYNIENTVNASLRENSPTKFDAGGLGFSQNTTNFDVTKKFGTLNVAFGAEYRHENYKINAGEPYSYNKYDINGNVASGLPSENNLLVTDFFGAGRPGGSQVFPGYKPVNAIDKGRNSVAVYGDLEYDVTDKWLVNGAIRYENYSDFGNTTTYKLASRYKITENINLRGAVSTGFRAPSLHQIYFNSTSTQFVGGVPFEVGTFNNDSQAAQLLGIPKLKQEESQSGSIGFTAKIPAANITFTADAYYVKIKDRVVLTDQFSRPGGTPAPGTPNDILNGLFDQAGATAATFFANAIDTESKGIDVVISNKVNLGEGLTLKNDLSGTISNTKRVGDIHASPILEAAGQVNRYYSESSRIYLEEAVPRVKANLTNTLTYKKFDFFLRNVYFGQVTDPNTADVNGDGRVEGAIINNQVVEIEHPVWGGKVITDLSVGFNITKAAKIVIGANNIFDIYPDTNTTKQTVIRPRLVSGAIDYTAAPSTIDLTNNGQFIYSRNVSQFGQNGRFVFARLSYKF